MPEITLVFPCGRTAKSDGKEDKTPQCPHCGLSVERTVAPPPRFSGNVNSPLKVDSNA